MDRRVTDAVPSLLVTTSEYSFLNAFLPQGTATAGRGVAHDADRRTAVQRRVGVDRLLLRPLRTRDATRAVRVCSTTLLRGITHHWC